MNEKIDEILKTYAGDDTDLCYYIFDILKQTERPGSGLKYFMEKIRTRNSDATYVLEKKFSINELQQLDSIYAKYTNELLTAVVNKAHLANWSVDKFYNVLWEKLDTDILFEDDKTKSFVLFKLAQNSLMPYIEIESPLSMDDEKFSDILERNKDTIIKIRHILALNFTQKTEVASLILKEIQKNELYEEQCVILAIALDDFTQVKVNGLMQMLENANVKIEQK